MLLFEKNNRIISEKENPTKAARIHEPSANIFIQGIMGTALYMSRPHNYRRDPKNISVITPQQAIDYASSASPVSLIIS